MTARKIILLTLAFLLPCGFVILLTRSVLRSSFGERFLTFGTSMSLSSLGGYQKRQQRKIVESKDQNRKELT